MKHFALALAMGILGTSATACAQSVLFDFNNGPQYTGTPLDQVAGGLRAHFDSTGGDPRNPGYSIQNIAQVIGMLPVGFSGLGLSPNSVYGCDLTISFWDAVTGASVYLNSVSMLVAPQELACDSSSTMKLSAFDGTTFVGSATAISSDQNYTWPVIDLTYASATRFDNIVIHFQSGPPTGGDWGPIFVADNLQATPAAVPEPASVAGLAVGALSVMARLRRHRHVL